MPEPLLTENPNRYVLLPIEHNDIYKLYKNLVSVRWIVEEIDMTKDKQQFDLLTSNEKHFIKCILGFFAGSDGIVNENLACRFYNEVQYPEAKAFYSEQLSNETVHNETYARLIETYFDNKQEKLMVLQAIRTMPFVQKKANWALKWISSNSNFAVRLVSFAIVEGVFFSGAFCSIYWFKSRNILPGLTLSNEFISRDEGVHTDFACLLYSKLVNKLSTEQIYSLFIEAVDIEKEFILEALPCSMIGMNSKLMSNYIEYVADRLLVQLNYNKIWGVSCPFDFMESISMEGKTNFFESRPTQYQKSSVLNTGRDNSFTITDDF